MTAYITVLVALAGLLIYVLASNPKLVRIGEILLFSGVLSTCIMIANQAKRLFVFSMIALALSLSACAHGPTPPPVTPISTQQYDAAFGSCMAAAGISDVTGIGTKILQILETPGLTQAQITQRIEALGIPAAGQAIEHVAICAVEAWSVVHPVTSTSKPTAGQGAVRVFQARHTHAPVAPGVHN